MTLGNRVRQLREGRGLSKAELAEKIDVDPSYISHIESGRTKLPSTDVLKALARALEVPATELTNAILNVPEPEDIDLADPELHLMFDDIGQLTADEREGIKTIIRVYLRQTRRGAAQE